MIMIILTVTPGGYSNRGQLFDGAVDGRQIVTRSTQPLLDGARALLAEGADPAAQIAMRHAGRHVGALRSTVGAAARLSVAEGEARPALRRWKPQNPRAREPPMRPDDAPATLVAL